MKTPRGASESSTTSDNTTEFIDIVKKYDVVYNTHNPDYKNVEVKMKVWTQIADEIGLSIDASKRKWKNLRDSYTKYLRSFRIGTKTSKKYQYWAHAEHMDFLKPYQGPGRNSAMNGKGGPDDEDTECDLGFQVLAKASTSTMSSDDDVKPTPPISSASAAGNHGTTTTLSETSGVTASATTTPTTASNTSHTFPSTTSSLPASSTPTTTTNSALLMPMPSLPTVHLPPQLASKPPSLSAAPTHPALAAPGQLYPMPQLKTAAGIPIIPPSSSGGNVGCLIIEPQLFASADTFKKEFTAPNLGMLQNNIGGATSSSINNSILSATPAPTYTTASAGRLNPPLITKLRRVQASPQTAAINLSFAAMQQAQQQQQQAAAAAAFQQPPSKIRKTIDFDVASVLQANRELDANTLFFLSLARSVRALPSKYQSLAKMRCMRIVSDLELELENANDCQAPPQPSVGGDDCTIGLSNQNNNIKYYSVDSPPPLPLDNGAAMHLAASVAAAAAAQEACTEHFVYVMSPSRVESMIDISSDDEEATQNGN